ncbi:MAG: hypothetical protein ACYTGB_20280 [Planctomycetota bacterium]
MTPRERLLTIIRGGRADRVPLMLECFEFASREEVEAATRAAFEGGRERMVLRNSAGPLGEMDSTTVANYHRLVDVWEELSEL